jgi:hypothetical protein
MIAIHGGVPTLVEMENRCAVPPERSPPRRA